MQVCISLADGATREREFRSLIKAAKTFQVKKIYIITLDEEETPEIEYWKIEIKPAWKWMLEG